MNNPSPLAPRTNQGGDCLGICIVLLFKIFQVDSVLFTSPLVPFDAPISNSSVIGNIPPKSIYSPGIRSHLSLN